MPPTTYALELLGFMPIPPGVTVSGCFRRIEAFEVRGFSLDDGIHFAFKEFLNRIPVEFAIGNDINDLAETLQGKKFCEDVNKWCSEKRVSPPFLLTMFGPTGQHDSTGSHFKDEVSGILTHDSFGAARGELENQSNAASPSLLTAMRVMFSRPEQSVRFRHVETVFIGRTPDGRLIKDLRFESSAAVYTSQRIEGEAFARTVKKAVSLANKLDPKIAKFHMLGAEERDSLRKFLFLFLFIERFVHLTFSNIDHELAVSSLLEEHDRISVSGAKLLGEHRRSWQDLRNRFVWCAMHSWTHISDVDVQTFDRVKAVRDKIAHGAVLSPSGDDVIELEQLVMRILEGLES